MAIKFAQVPESNEGCGFVSGTAPGFGDSHPVLTWAVPCEQCCLLFHVISCSF